MRSEDLTQCIEEAFAGLERPSLEEMAAADYSVEDQFLDAVESRTWQELRPLRHYIGDGSDIMFLSAKAYQYYLPAYLYALIDEPGDEFYLNGVLDSLWYEEWRDPDSEDRLSRWLSVPPGGWKELMPELAEQMPQLTYEERKVIAERRVDNAEKLAYLKELTGRDWRDRAYLRLRWEERMPVLTNQQKSCITAILLHILERTTCKPDVDQIQTMFDKYWRAFLVKPENR